MKTEIIFKVISFISFFLAVVSFIYARKKFIENMKNEAIIFQLIEKLRSSRNTLYHISERSRELLYKEGKEENQITEKEEFMLKDLRDNMWRSANNIDEGQDWQSLSARQILVKLKK